MIDFKGPHENALIKIENAIVKKILSNVPPPNAPSTIRQKGSSKTLVDTGEMVGHVTHRQTIKSGQIIGEIGIFDPEIAKRAMYNEYGTRDIPARPFLRPAFDETAPKAAEEMANEIWDQIKKQMR
ncbi:MAG: HK97-gp10 family putative phage morphogenesis protein [Bacteroidales bacterium]|jgi:HK97 gp10 family phage protein